ncbi:MAG: hypothetical protein JW797_10200 [Bradymonadales bacterium]|nr:hypothetical protein [Bradymonadales bacterium]
MRLQNIISWLTAVLLVGVSGCPGDNQEGEADRGLVDSGPDASDADDQGDRIDPLVDADPDMASCALCTAGSCLAYLTGEVEDEEATPIAQAIAQLCVRVAPSGTLRCLMPSTTEEDGSFAILIPEGIHCLEQAVLRVVLPYAQTTSLYCEIELPQSGGILHLAEPLVLYETTPATTMPTGGEADQVHTVVFADGLEVEVIPERFWAGEEEYTTLASRHFGSEIPEFCFLKDAPALIGLYGFSPEAEVDEPSFAMRIPNHSGLDAGTTVDLYLLGGLNTTLGEDEVIGEGEWVRYGQGTVNGAGTFIDVPFDPGLPHFLWLGYAIAAD